MRVKKTKNKFKEGRGTGTGADYKPWITTREFYSSGTCANVVDPKTGRMVDLLSQAELAWYWILRWDDNVIDIREQYPLDLKLSVLIAHRLRIKHPFNESTPMTTDLLVTKNDGHMEAYSVKSSKRDMDARHEEITLLEREYWESLGVPFRVVYKDDVNPVLVRNIEDVFRYYDASRVFDDVSRVKHLISHKKIAVDMGVPINYRAISKALIESGEGKNL